MTNFPFPQYTSHTTLDTYPIMPDNAIPSDVRARYGISPARARYLLSIGQAPWQPVKRKPRQSRAESVRPAFGSAEWCETQGDDLGESPDY